MPLLKSPWGIRDFDVSLAEAHSLSGRNAAYSRQDLDRLSLQSLVSVDVLDRDDAPTSEMTVVDSDHTEDSVSVTVSGGELNTLYYVRARAETIYYGNPGRIELLLPIQVRS